MATISNRSAFVVTVKNAPQKTLTFPYNRASDAEAYVRELIAAGYKQPQLVQEENSWLVRVRRIGRPDQNKTFSSLREAETFVRQIEADQERGLFRDYTEAAQTTTADLIERYIREDCPGMKGGDNYAIILNAMLADSRHELRKRIALRKQEMKEFGEAKTPLNANRQPMNCLEWLNLPLTDVMPSHIEDFIADRLEYVAPSTVDRQIDLLSSIYNRAMKSWRIYLEFSPMQGVKRPKFFNERDRRLRGDEELRLLEAARQEDHLRSFDAHVETLAEQNIAAAMKLGTHYARNNSRKEAYEAARRTALEHGFPHIPMMEAFLVFQLATAARRGETLGLFWNQVDQHARTASLPTSKNGRPRRLALRADVLELLNQLPRTSDLVFDIGLKELVNAWKRICDAAKVDDLRIHDLRHEGISRAAESGKFPSVLDLQAFSGHRDVRSLTRYTHLCMTAIAHKLDEAELERQKSMDLKSRARLKASFLNSLGASSLSHPTTNEEGRLEGVTDNCDDGVKANNVVRFPAPVRQ